MSDDETTIEQVQALAQSLIRAIAPAQHAWAQKHTAAGSQPWELHVAIWLAATALVRAFDAPANVDGDESREALRRLADSIALETSDQIPEAPIKARA